MRYPDKEPSSDVKKSRFQENTALLESSQTAERRKESLLFYALNPGSTLWKECSGKTILDTSCTGYVYGKFEAVLPSQSWGISALLLALCFMETCRFLKSNHRSPKLVLSLTWIVVNVQFLVRQ